MRCVSGETERGHATCFPAGPVVAGGPGSGPARAGLMRKVRARAVALHQTPLPAAHTPQAISQRRQCHISEMENTI